MIDHDVSVQLPRNIAKHWQPFPAANFIDQKHSSQEIFLSSGAEAETAIKEVFYWGSKAIGKTEALIVAYAMHVGKGYSQWDGVIVRPNYKSLNDVIKKCKKLFAEFFGDNAVWHASKSDYYWEFLPGKERLYIRAGETLEDYETKFHGNEFQFIGVEEMPTWKDMVFYKMIKTCLRASASNGKKAPPLLIRATGNPLGDSWNACEDYFMPDGVGVTTGEGKNTKLGVRGIMDENIYLIDFESYSNSFNDLTQREIDAYRWGIPTERSDTFFADCFDTPTHFIKPFNIPSNWTVDRSLDWGTGAPFSVLWFAESKGENFTDGEGKRRWVPKGSIFVINEYYGCKSKDELNVGIHLDAADLSQNILAHDRKLKNTIVNNATKIQDGPADNSIWNDQKMIKQKCIAKLLEDNGKGTKWKQSNKNKGSRIAGAQYIRSMLTAAKKDKADFPHLYIFNTCKFLKTNLLNLKEDPAAPGDVISVQVPDHDYDALRYRLLQKDNKSYIFSKFN